MGRLTWGALVLGVTASLSGCSNFKFADLVGPTPLYQLESGIQELPQRDQGPTVLLNAVNMPQYLDSEAVLQRQDDGRLIAQPRKARWAGALAENIQQVLLSQLAWRLDTQRIAIAPAPHGFAPQVQIELTISRFDSGPDIPAVLEGRWRLLGMDGQPKLSRLVRLEMPHEGAFSDQVQAQSVLLQQLSAQIAAGVQPMLNNANTRPATDSNRSRPRTTQPARPSGQTTTPILIPVKKDKEVFRF